MVVLPCGSKSIIRTFEPLTPKTAARLHTVVDFPTPPFWFETAIIFHIISPHFRKNRSFILYYIFSGLKRPFLNFLYFMQNKFFSFAKCGVCSMWNNFGNRVQGGECFMWNSFVAGRVVGSVPCGTTLVAGRMVGSVPCGTVFVVGCVVRLFHVEQFW